MQISTWKLSSAMPANSATEGWRSYGRRHHIVNPTVSCRKQDQAVTKSDCTQVEQQPAGIKMQQQLGGVRYGKYCA